MQFSLGYLLTSLILLWVFQAFVLSLWNKSTEISYSEFKNKLANAQIVEVIISDRTIEGKMKDPKGGASPLPFNTVSLRANIFETVLVPLINEQGEKEKGTYEFSWCCSFSWRFG